MKSAIEPVEAVKTDEPVQVQLRPRASEWLWQPWYAKLWWAAIVAYWAGIVNAGVKLCKIPV